jgi:hypothetical protein
VLTPELITAILGFGGMAAIVPKIIDGLLAWRSGRASAEKRKNWSLLERLADAEQRAEEEADFRRALEEYAGTLRILLIGAGYTMHRLPAWPIRKARLEREPPRPRRRATDD